MTPLLGACFGGAGFGQTVARASRSWVHDIKVETLARCGAGWQPARRLATAAVRCQRGIWPIDNRPQLAKLPHKSPRCLAYTYARIQAVLLMNRLGVHFCVAHPFGKPAWIGSPTSVTREYYPLYPQTPARGELTTGSIASSPHSCSSAQASQSQPWPRQSHCPQISVARCCLHRWHMILGSSLRASNCTSPSGVPRSRSPTTFSRSSVVEP